MNLNQLLYRHQMAMLHAQTATTRGDRDTQLDRVGAFAGHITDWRMARNLPNTGWPQDERLAAPASP